MAWYSMMRGRKENGLNWEKKTWTRNTERSLGSPENIAQWPMILKKKGKKKPSSDVTISSQGRVYWC